MQDNKLNQSIFIVILSYVVPSEKIDAFRSVHLDFFSDCYAKNLFITSGMQVPRSGGIIVARCESKEVLEKNISQ